MASSTFSPPPISGMSTTGGFEGYIQMRGTGTLLDLENQTNQLVQEVMAVGPDGKRKYPAIGMLRNLFSTGSPQLYANLDRERCKDMGIDVVQPSVNRSQREFTAYEGKVVFGLGGIKNVGDEAIRELVESRMAEGEFASLFDLCCRVNLRKVTKRVLESLIKGGACAVYLPLKKDECKIC